MTSVGQRVGALISANGGVVKFLGFGTRIEDKVPPANAGGFGQMLNEMGHTNICLKMDDGTEVFGCECWWGPEESIKTKFEGWEFEKISINDHRSGKDA
ncbi:hypothetical protein [Vreelandella sulfidaeris]|uniref:Uncharacterized protein n=1 Tax=Vreelandella sulfidaeris TaxID=115553 RepID=A0A455UBC4_9GAMM|nr:hypothetical protein HSBAA_29140 [Halomonas sulfidaeris]